MKMSEEQDEYYGAEEGSAGGNWDDGDDGLQALMHAAADADARDNQALIQENQNAEYYSSENASNYYTADETEPKVTGFYGEVLAHASKGLRTSVCHEEVPKTSAKAEKHTYYEKPENSTGSSDNQNLEFISKTKTNLVTTNPLNRKSTSSHYEYSSPLDGSSGDHRRINKRHYSDDEDRNHEKSEGHANIVAEHYNTLQEKGLDERLKSRIFYMRNFNNWIKSMLINEYLNKVKNNMKHNSPIRVMDMCCGKGGDLLKWRKGNISHLICTDIAAVSLEQCESRYREMCSRNARERNAGRIYTAEFIPADCTRAHLRKKYKDPSMKLDLVSCQFAFHYSFESLPQAECMLKNASESLQPGGYLIGTIPDANDIVARQRQSASKTFGNDVYQITFLCNSDMPPLFGAKYNFHLDGVVDCPEFLVHFGTFVKLARKHGLQLVNKERFDEFYRRMNSEGSGLLNKMQSLETYPPFEGTSLMGTAEHDYNHCVEFFKKTKSEENVKIGTLSKSEWEAASLYLTFAFRKAKTTWDVKGNPVYVFS